jgi:hypothetical protein
MTRHEFTDLLERQLEQRGVPFTQAELLAFAESVWPVAAEEPDPVRWAGEFARSPRTSVPGPDSVPAMDAGEVDPLVAGCRARWDRIPEITNYWNFRNDLRFIGGWCLSLCPLLAMLAVGGYALPTVPVTGLATSLGVITALLFVGGIWLLRSAGAADRQGSGLALALLLAVVSFSLLISSDDACPFSVPLVGFLGMYPATAGLRWFAACRRYPFHQRPCEEELEFLKDLVWAVKTADKESRDVICFRTWGIWNTALWKGLLADEFAIFLGHYPRRLLPLCRICVFRRDEVTFGIEGEGTLSGDPILWVRSKERHFRLSLAPHDLAKCQRWKFEPQGV